jgi:hypothetical protein
MLKVVQGVTLVLFNVSNNSWYVNSMYTNYYFSVEPIVKMSEVHPSRVVQYLDRLPIDDGPFLRLFNNYQFEIIVSYKFKIQTVTR